MSKWHPDTRSPFSGLAGKGKILFALQCRRSLPFWQNFFPALSALQSVRITHGREDFFSRRERGARGATTGKEIRQGLFLRALRTPVPSGRVLVAACRVRPWIITFGARCFEQEKTERTEHRWTWSISPFPLLPPVQIVCLVAACRAAPLRLRVFALIAFLRSSPLLIEMNLLWPT